MAIQVKYIGQEAITNPERNSSIIQQVFRTNTLDSNMLFATLLYPPPMPSTVQIFNTGGLSFSFGRRIGLFPSSFSELVL